MIEGCYYLAAVKGYYDGNQVIVNEDEHKRQNERLRKKGTVTDYDTELASYREEKYGK